VPGSALSATAGLPANGCGSGSESRFIAARLLGARVGRRGANPQHAVETLDTVVGRGSPMDLRHVARNIGATGLTPFRAISAQEIQQWLE
jgi:hypothetical protein